MAPSQILFIVAGWRKGRDEGDVYIFESVQSEKASADSHNLPVLLPSAGIAAAPLFQP